MLPGQPGWSYGSGQAPGGFSFANPNAAANERFTFGKGSGFSFGTGIAATQVLPCGHTEPINPDFTFVLEKRPCSECQRMKGFFFDFRSLDPNNEGKSVPIFTEFHGEPPLHYKMAIDSESTTIPNPKIATRNMFGLGGSSAPKLKVKTRSWNVFPVGKEMQFTNPVIIIGYRIHHLSWSPTAPPTFDPNTGYITMDCPQLANGSSLLGNIQRSVIASWNIFPNTLTPVPMSMAKFTDVMLNEPTELNRVEFQLYNGSGAFIALTPTNAVALGIEFLLPS